MSKFKWEITNIRERDRQGVVKYCELCGGKILNKTTLAKRCRFCVNLKGNMEKRRKEINSWKAKRYQQIIHSQPQFKWWGLHDRKAHQLKPRLAIQDKAESYRQIPFLKGRRMRVKRSKVWEQNHLKPLYSLRCTSAETKTDELTHSAVLASAMLPG